MFKKAWSALLIVALLCLVFAAGFFSELEQYKQWKEDRIDQFDTMQSENELTIGSLVKGTVDHCYGQAAEQETTNTVYGIPTSKRTSMKYYVIEMYDKNSTWVLYGTGNKSEWAVLDSMTSDMEAFYAKLEAGTATEFDIPKGNFALTGQVSGLGGELRDIYADWYGDDFVADCADTVYIIHKDFDHYKWTMPGLIASCAGTVIFVALSIFMLIRSKRKAQYGY